MTEPLRGTWDDIAAHWDDWGSPLRPVAADLTILRAALGRWREKNPVDVAQIFLCGVTPEVAALEWPGYTRLLGLDQSERMIRVVWPGDIPGVRQAQVGDWLHPPFPPHSQDVAIVDGGFGFFSHPEGLRSLAASLWRALQPRGLFMTRLYAQAAQREPLADVLKAARSGHIGSFHAFKWRLAMALQADSRTGVKQHDIWQACMDAGMDRAQLPQPGWSPRAVATIRFYQKQPTRLYFPTVAEFRNVLNEFFEDVEVSVADYELADRCPILTARPRANASP